MQYLSVKDKLTIKTTKQPNYSFLTPVTDYIEKNYKEIKNELSLENISEILEEVSAKNIIMVKDIKGGIQLVTTTSTFRPIAIYRKDSKLNPIESLEGDLSIGRFHYSAQPHTSLEKEVENYYNYYRNDDAGLDSFYYVNDIKELQKYFLAELEIKAELAVKEALKHKKANIADINTNFKLAKQTGNRFDFDEMRKIKLVEALKNDPLKIQKLIETAVEEAVDFNY